RRLGRALPGSPREVIGWLRQLRCGSQPELREEPEGAPSARTRHDGHERAALSDHADRRCADQSEQRLRSADAAEPESRVRPGIELHDEAALGLLRTLAAGCRAAEGLRDPLAR